MFAAWTPTMRTSGLSARSAIAIPAASPPPPIGTTTVPSSGSCSTSSSPIVPCPAITRSSSKAWTNVAPVESTNSCAAAIDSSKPGADELDLRPVVPGGVDLRHRRVLRHEDGGRDAGLARRPGDRLAVIARAGRDDAGGALLVGQRRDRVDGAADLERARALEVLGLQLHGPAGAPRERLGRVDRRDARDPGDPGPRRLEVSECRELVLSSIPYTCFQDRTHGRERVEPACLHLVEEPP